jgi:hypothetical protein
MSKKNGNGKSKKMSKPEVASGVFFLLIFIGVVVVLVYFLTKSPEHFKFGGISTSTPTCTLCTPGGYVSPDGTQCTPCPAGKAGKAAGYGTSTCIPCPTGHYQSLPGQTSCKTCTPGPCPPDTQLVSTCNATADRVCSPCPAPTTTVGASCDTAQCGPGGGCEMSSGLYCNPSS